MNVSAANATPVPNQVSTRPALVGAPALPAGYTLREFSTADHGKALALWSSCEGIGLSESDAPEAINAFITRNPGLSVVVEHTAAGRRTLVGTLLCGHDGRRGCLYHLAIAPAHRRLGLGRTLVDTCLTHLRQLGIVKCNLFLFATNAAGRGFWLRQGWSAREDLVIVQQVLRK